MKRGPSAVRHDSTVRRIALRLAIVIATTLSSMPWLAGSAAAYVNTCGTPSNYHVGWVDTNNSLVEGTYAVIATRYASTCLTDTTNNNFTNQYSMIVSGNYAGWAQVGYMRWYGSSTYYFSQLVSGHSIDTKTGTSPLAMGSTHYYYNKWVVTCLCMEEIIDRTLWASSTWNPWTAWPTPFYPQYTGETRYLESDVSGTSSAPASYTNLGQQDNSTNNWELVPCGELTSANDGWRTRSDGQSWHNPQTSCPSFNVYTG